MNYRDQARALAEAKHEHVWLAEAPGHCLQQTLMDLDKACRQHGTFKVRWRSNRRWRPSFRFPEGNKMIVQQLNRNHVRVKLPKLGWVRFRLSRRLDDAVIRSATLTREGKHWYVSFLLDDGHQSPATHALPGTAVGVDRGVAVAFATSDGHLADCQFLTDGERRRPLALQRRLARTTKHSRNRAKTRTALGAIRSRERCRRKDFCAQSAHRLAINNELVVIEALKTKQMTRSAKRNRPSARNQRPSQVRAESRHSVQRVAPVRPGTSVGGTLYRNPHRDRAAATHVATLLGVWACGPEIP
jgi:putative transposase